MAELVGREVDLTRSLDAEAGKAAVPGVGEVDRAVGADGDVVRAVEVLALPVECERLAHTVGALADERARHVLADEQVEVVIQHHPVALELLEQLDFPLAAPSANRFGHVSPTNAAAVVEEIGKYLTKDDLVLDGGLCHVGVESTIIDCTGATPRILRPGAISELMIEECTGLPVLAGNLLTKGAEDIRVSGSLENHYAPAAKVFLNQSPMTGQGFIADSSIKTPEGVIRLASPNNDEEFARMLYSALRAADAKGLSEVVVIQPIGAGIALAIRDRLVRAAKGR